jgi:hypothetical protein
MPTITRLPGDLRICQFYNDHDPPHFHVRRPGMDVEIRIADLAVLHGSIRPADLIVVKTWAGRHRAALALNWVMARAGLPMPEVLEP